MSKKKENERFYLDKFLTLLGKVPDKIISDESPDFIVMLKQKKIGIELINFHSSSKGEHGRPRREIEETWAVLQGTIMGEVEKCNELRETNGLLFFKKLDLPPKSKQREFTDELIKLSLEMINSGYKEIKPGVTYPILNKYLKKFYLEKVGCYIPITWEWNYNVSSVGITEEELTKASKSKIIKASKYKEKDIDELWLLIISEHRLSQAMGIRLSEKLNTFDQLDNLLRQSAYNKIYLYQFMFDVIYEYPGWVKIGKGNFV